MLKKCGKCPCWVQVTKSINGSELDPKDWYYYCQANCERECEEIELGIANTTNEWIGYAHDTGYELDTDNILDWALGELKAMLENSNEIKPGYGITQDMIDLVDHYRQERGLKWDEIDDKWS